MSDIVKHYSNGAVTVVWKPGLCAHSENCWRGLASVFNPGKKPWIDVTASDTESIIAQVSKCPSGALSIERENKGSQE
ncbi:MAG: (4Fe-4S)-binding protein [Bacteroidetes bacterium]|nr:(4Fe-4S)-binding protein [Bacteroidota bacterium]